MQQDFDTNFPELGIRIIGINEFGEEAGNPLVDEELPWLQDIDSDGDNESDVWQLWDVEWRDMTILDRQNVPVTTFNLTSVNLADPSNYETVRQAFLTVASGGTP
jgi:hypothetical protein